MVGREFGNRNAGSVKAAINMYGEKINLGDNLVLEKKKMIFSEVSLLFPCLDSVFCFFLVQFLLAQFHLGLVYILWTFSSKM